MICFKNRLYEIIRNYTSFQNFYMMSKMNEIKFIKVVHNENVVAAVTLMPDDNLEALNKKGKYFFKHICACFVYLRHSRQNGFHQV